MTGIRTEAELDDRLRAIRGRSGGEDVFLAEVRALALDLAVGIGCDSLLKVALAGFPPTSFAQPGVDPSAGFSGRDVVLSPTPTRLEELTRGRSPDEVLGLLVESCGAAVGASGNQRELIQIYLAFLARPDVRREVGADHPVDLHVVSTLTAERASISMLSPVTFDLDVELALYEWFWGVLGAPGPAAFLDEVVARRGARLRLKDEPVAVAAAQLCVMPVKHLLPFDGPADALADPPLSLDELLSSAKELSLRSSAWVSRLEGLQLEPVAEGDPDQRPFVMSGHALRWLLDRGVPIGPLRLGRIDDYVKSVVEMLDRGEGTEPLGAHMNVVMGLAEEGTHLSLAEELAVLAWLCAAYDVYVDFEVFLDVREQALRGDFD